MGFTRREEGYCGIMLIQSVSPFLIQLTIHHSFTLIRFRTFGFVFLNLQNSNELSPELLHLL